MKFGHICNETKVRDEIAKRLKVKLVKINLKSTYSATVKTDKMD